jgi:serine/threonine-protein kinase
MGPRQIGPYEVVAPLGSGGMGEVFLARDTRLPRKVAIKRVRSAGDPDGQRQIMREARTVALLNHQNIAAIYDILDHDGTLHIVMEYVEGETLASKLREGPLAPEIALEYTRQIAHALAYAHGEGVIHCDIKPSNVMITPDGRARVLDFGIARFDTTLRGDDEKTTSTNVLRGTPSYMAPEVRLGAPPSTRSDVYSLGIVLFELLTARRPYEGVDPLKLLDSPGNQTPTLRDIVPAVSRELSDLVGRAIAPDPRRRIGSIGELRMGLDAVATSKTRTGGQYLRLFSWRWATPALALTAGCIALLAGVARLPGAGTPTRESSVMGVLIFNTSGDDKNDHLGAGLTDSLISTLAAAPGITAVPRTTLVPYLAKPGELPKAVRDLRLTHVLTGGVQRSGPQLRFTMNLLNADQAILWTGTFDGSVDDVFHLEQRVADGTMKALRARGFVTADAVAQARRPPTSNPAAFETYSHGRVLLDRSDVPGNIDRALGLFERAVQMDPQFVRAHAAIGETAWLKYRTTKDRAWIDRARVSTMEALQLAPDDPSVRHALAVIDHGTGRSDQAIAHLEQILKIQPASDEAHRLLGRIYSDRGQFARAIEELREALRIRPDYAPTIRALGLAYYDAGKLDDAIAVFTTLTALQPDNASAFQNLGTAYHAAGQLDRAEVAYERANALAPKATTMSNIGIIRHMRGDYARAAAAYRQAIALHSKDPWIHRNLGDALWMAGDRAAARAAYRQAIELANDELKVNSTEAQTHALVAFCEAKLGRGEAARRSLNEALRLAPNDAEVVYKLAVIEVLNRNLDAGLAALQRAVKLGYPAKRLAADRDLDPIRTRPGFPSVG